MATNLSAPMPRGSGRGENSWGWTKFCHGCRWDHRGPFFCCRNIDGDSWFTWWSNHSSGKLPSTCTKLMVVFISEFCFLGGTIETVYKNPKDYLRLFIQSHRLFETIYVCLCDLCPRPAAGESSAQKAELAGAKHKRRELAEIQTSHTAFVPVTPSLVVWIGLGFEPTLADYCRGNGTLPFAIFSYFSTAATSFLESYFSIATTSS